MNSVTPRSSRWLAVANFAIDSLESFEVAAFDQMHVYGSDLPDPLFSEHLLSLATLRNLASPDHRGSLQVGAGGLSVATADFNEDPVHRVVDRVQGKFAYFTDILLSRHVLQALGHRWPSMDSQATVALVRGLVKMMPPCTEERWSRREGSWQLEIKQPGDPLAKYWTPWRDDANAGMDQVETLRACIATLGGPIEGPAARFNTLLSGGVDSGLVTALAATQGYDVAAYTVGSPWGDEFAESAQLGAWLGLDVSRLELDEDQWLQSVVPTIRWLGSSNAENVEIALTGTAVHAHGLLRDDATLLTGYGSDLLNAGIFAPFDTPDQLARQVIEAVDKARYSGELSVRFASFYGSNVVHPFWDPNVRDVALGTAAHLKVVDGQDKHHLRSAARTILPNETAWRTKIAVHHGGGLQKGIRTSLRSKFPRKDAGQVYELALCRLLSLENPNQLEQFGNPVDLGDFLN